MHNFLLRLHSRACAITLTCVNNAWMSFRSAWSRPGAVSCRQRRSACSISHPASCATMLAIASCSFENGLTLSPRGSSALIQHWQAAAEPALRRWRDSFSRFLRLVCSTAAMLWSTTNRERCLETPRMRNPDNYFRHDSHTEPSRAASSQPRRNEKKSTALEDFSEQMEFAP